MKVGLNKRFFVFMVFCGILCSCGKKSTDVKGYLRYVNDSANGLVQQKEVDGILFSMHYLPAEWMALNELKKVKPEAEEWKKTIEEYAGLEYCKLTVSCMECEHIYTALSQEELNGQETEAYLNYDSQSDFILIEGNDTSNCKLYSFSKTYGLGKQFEVALAFEPGLDRTVGDKTIVFDASAFNRGVLKFKFDENSIEKVPTLTM